jgi:GT2 family glycosyltransferase
MNSLAHHANGEILLMLNDDIEVLEAEWLTEMVSLLQIPGVAVVGAMLLYPDRKIQHAGVVSGIGGLPGHAYRGTPPAARGYFGDLMLVRNVSAVTGACLAIKRSVFEEIGGFDEVNLPIAFNDIALCFEALSHGYRIVVTPYSRLIHYESFTRGPDDVIRKRERALMEIYYLKGSYADFSRADPYYNPNLRPDASYQMREVVTDYFEPQLMPPPADPIFEA